MYMKSALIVDDDKAIRGLVRALLRRHGFDVDEAAGACEGAACIRTKRYDAVVLDLMMPDGTGEDVLRFLATQRPDAKCVVVISATAMTRIDQIDAANVVAKLRKPFDISDLTAAVERCDA